MILYGIDLSSQGTEVALERFWTYFGDGELLDPPPPYLSASAAGAQFTIDRDADMRAYTERLVRGTMSELTGIDTLIQQISTHWRLERMALVDRNLLRLGVYELTKNEGDVPRGVVINEAVELAKLFGTAESSAFVNGILDRVGR